MSQWYAVRSATRSECKAAAAIMEAAKLAEIGVAVFVPKEASWGWRGGQPGKVRVERPLITGYLFVLIDPEDVSFLSGVDYVHDVLGYLDERGDPHPLAIPLKLIIELQADEAAGLYDRTLYFKPKYRPKKGDKVRATAGPWLGWFGKIIATPKGQRVHVKFEDGATQRGAIVQGAHLAPAA